MKGTFVILWGIMISSHLYSNDSAKVNNNLLGIQIGCGFHRYIDPLESAGVYGGAYIPLNFNWITISKNHINEFSFSYSNTSLKPRVTQDANLTDLTARYLNMNYQYHQVVFNFRKISVFLGANANTYLAFRDKKYYIISPVKTTIAYQNRDVFASLNLSLVSKIDLENKLLLIHINNSVFGYITNRKYNVNDDSENDFLFYPKFNSYNFQIHYFHLITRNLYLNLNYKFYYYHYPRSEDIFITEGAHNQIVAGLCIKL